MTDVTPGGTIQPGQATAPVLSSAVPSSAEPITVTGHLAPVTVVVCAYTLDRWQLIRDALGSVLAQLPAPAQVVLVVDHNPSLSQRARAELTATGELSTVAVVDSDEPKGLSGARNCGLRVASQPVTAFLDDDAQAREGWLSALIEPYQDGNVVATGGAALPAWPGARPRWLPPAFYWVVGCSYLGLPESAAPVRNPIGANMSMRTELARALGGFDAAVGRVGSRPRGCEETELAIRLTASTPGSLVMYVPSAAVDHHVAPDRVSARYFLRRCWHEGMSKADVVRLAGAASGLERERRHVASVLPAAALADLRATLTGDIAGLMRAAAALSGLTAAAAGYAARRARLAGRGPATAEIAPLQPVPQVYAK